MCVRGSIGANQSQPHLAAARHSLRAPKINQNTLRYIFNQSTIGLRYYFVAFEQMKKRPQGNWIDLCC